MTASSKHSSSQSPLSSCDPHYRLRLSSNLQKAIVAPFVIIGPLRDSLSHLSLSPAIFIDERMPLIFHRYKDLLSPLALQYLDTLTHYSEHIVVSPDENYLRTTYYCPYTNELRADLTSTFEFDPLGQSIRTFRLKFYYDPIL